MAATPSRADLRRMATIAKMIAINVRNEMEDFHVRHLSDEQMRELNPLIRNAIYTALVGFLYARDAAHPRRNRCAVSWINFLMTMIPRYWEEPVLTEDFKTSMQMRVSERILPEEMRLKLATFFQEYLTL
jgi:hypothetical protein